MSVDVTILDSTEVSGQNLVMVGGSASGLLVSGVAKLAQRVLLELFTERGTMLYLPDRGTTLATSIRLRLFASEYDVLTAFAAALVDLQRNLQDEEETTDPDNERFGSANLTRLLIAPGALVATIDIISRNGSSKTGVTIPIRLTY